MKTITILTPTYNRADYLEKLYGTLCRQTNKDFCWMVVDDGSTDNTREKMAGFMQRAEIDIESMTKENGGKHTALNMGMKYIRTELVFIVDSDDYLPPDAIQIILDYHEKYRKDKEKLHLCGYSFLRFYSNGKVNTAFFPKDEEIATYLQVRINGGIGGDKAEVFYSDALREYPFPEIEGEKFLAEDVIWMRMSEKYKMVHINRCIYISDYLEGGLTKTGRRMKIYSPKGMMLRSKIYLGNKEVKEKIKGKMMLLYVVYGKFAGLSYSELKREIEGHRLLFALSYLPGIFFYIKWKH